MKWILWILADRGSAKPSDDISFKSLSTQTGFKQMTKNILIILPELSSIYFVTAWDCLVWSVLAKHCSEASNSWRISSYLISGTYWYLLIIDTYYWSRSSFWSWNYVVGNSKSKCFIVIFISLFFSPNFKLSHWPPACGKANVLHLKLFGDCPLHNNRLI